MKRDETFSLSAITAIVLASVVIAAITGTVFSPENSIAILGFAAVICTSLLTLLKVEAVETHSAEGREKVMSLVDSNREKITTLVGANMEINLQTSKVALRRLADITGDPEDIKAAELAEQASTEREAKQVVIKEPQNGGENQNGTI